jgi:pimeloyl-ACP methyl ester carboxylesterase
MSFVSRREALSGFAALGAGLAAASPITTAASEQEKKAVNQARVTDGRVTTEGDEIYYQCRGQGPPLLMISGGLGDAGIYSFVADILADEFRVITYDRRGHSRSSRHDPQNFEVGQQGRDAVAVLRAAGEKSAIVFGSSGGALFALEMAKSQPQDVKAVIAHEPPAVRVLPDADKWLKFFAQLYLTTLNDMQKASRDFAAAIAVPAITPDPEILRSDEPQKIQERQRKNSSPEFSMRYEILPCSSYQPDVSAIKKNGVKVFLGIGKLTRDAGTFYGRTAPILAKRPDCEMMTFPGHHWSYGIKPREWAATLRGLLHRI